MNRTELSIRLPKPIIQKLRDLRDSYPNGRDISSLINCCMRRCKGVVNIENLTPTTRAASDSIRVFLDAEWATCEPEHVRAAIESELQSLNPIPIRLDK
jgi:hypothetical protein